MNKPAAIQASYADYRRVKGRKVLQLIFEVPLEQAPQVHDVFGEPMPDGSTWVGIARIDPNAKAEPERKGGKLAQLAGIICQEPAFRKFIEEKYSELSPCDPTEFIRHMCGVLSRAELDHHESAGRRFKDIKLEYEAWMNVAA